MLILLSYLLMTELRHMNLWSGTYDLLHNSRELILHACISRFVKVSWIQRNFFLKFSFLRVPSCYWHKMAKNDWNKMTFSKYICPHIWPYLYYTMLNANEFKITFLRCVGWMFDSQYTTACKIHKYVYMHITFLYISFTIYSTCVVANASQ